MNTSPRIFALSSPFRFQEQASESIELLAAPVDWCIILVPGHAAAAGNAGRRLLTNRLLTLELLV
jgi:hypothetical protein